MYINQVLKYRNEFWRYILGFFTVFLGSQIIGSVPLILALFIKKYLGGDVNFSDETMIYRAFDPNIMLLLMLIPFLVGFVALRFWMKPIHDQPFKTLHSSKEKLNWNKVWFSFMLCALLVVASVIIGYYLSPDEYIINFKLVPFLIMLLIAGILIPIQSSFEEYLFRGYLMQGIAAYTKNRWMPLLVTSVVFGCMHLLNPEVEKLGYIVMVSYIGTGLFLGIITLMDDGLELAIGFHVANNLFTALLVTADWTAFQTHSVLKYIGEPSVSWDIFIPVLIVFPILIFIFSKKYKWSGWKEKLFGKLDESVVTNEIEQN